MAAWGQRGFLLSVSSGPGERHQASIMWESGTPMLLSLDPCVTGHQGDSCTVQLRLQTPHCQVHPAGKGSIQDPDLHDCKAMVCAVCGAHASQISTGSF